MNQRRRGIAVATVMGAALGACTPRIPVASPSTSPLSVHLTNVPFFADGSQLCGPSTLASILNYWGRPVSPERLKSEIYSRDLKGTLPIDMSLALKAHGLETSVSDGTFDDLRSELAKKRPVIAYLDFGTKRHPIGHYVVVTGYDDEKRGLYIHSGMRRDKFASYIRFNRGWSDTHRWMLTAHPKDSTNSNSVALSSTTLQAPQGLKKPAEFQAALSPDELIELGRTYEKLGIASAAAEKYKAALQLDPRFKPALLSLGNLAFENKDYRSAEKFYRRLLKIDPDQGAAHNNLAMTYLLEGKKLAQAELHARQATSSDLRPYAWDTLAQIYLKQGQINNARVAIQNARLAAGGNPSLLAEIHSTEIRLGVPSGS